MAGENTVPSGPGWLGTHPGAGNARPLPGVPANVQHAVLTPLTGELLPGLSHDSDVRVPTPAPPGRHRPRGVSSASVDIDIDAAAMSMASKLGTPRKRRGGSSVPPEGEPAEVRAVSQAGEVERPADAELSAVPAVAVPAEAVPEVAV